MCSTQEAPPSQQKWREGWFTIAKAILGLNTSNVCLPTTNDLVVQADSEKVFLMDGKYYLILFHKKRIVSCY